MSQVRITNLTPN